MRGPGTFARTAVLLFAGAYGVHQLRYVLTFGADVGSALEDDGHGYFVALEPVIGVALAVLLGAAVTRVLRGGPRLPTPTMRTRASAYALALLATYTAQELLEGALVAGHAAGLAGVFGAGGWIAVPAAAVIGVVCAALVRVADAAVARVVVRGVRCRVVAPVLSPVAHVEHVARRVGSLLGRRLAGRAPPALACSHS